MSVKPPHLTLRGYEGQDYLEKDVYKKENDYAQTWYVPLTSGQFHDHRQVAGDDCGFFEDQSVRCFAAFGSKLGRLYCDLEHRDLQECVMNEKKVLPKALNMICIGSGDDQRNLNTLIYTQPEKRYSVIRDVRFKKWLRGEIPHIYEPLADFLKSVHGAPTAYPTGHREKK